MRVFIAASAMDEPVTPLISVDSVIDVCASPAGNRPVNTVASFSRVVGDARVVEEVARENEQRHGKQREILRLGDSELDRNRDRQFRVLQEKQRPGNTDREGHRHAEEQQDRKRDEDDQHRRVTAGLKARLRLLFRRPPRALQRPP